VLRRGVVVLGVLAFGCSDSVQPLDTAAPGVVFTYPIDGQVDVPLGSRIAITFSEPVVESAAPSAVSLVGPAGAVMASVTLSENGKTVLVESDALEPGTTYGVQVQNAISPDAKNIPGSGPLFSFTTRNSRPRAAVPKLVAVNGGDPIDVTSFRPMFESTTIRLVFSEPLDPRTITQAAGGIELLDAGGSAVPAMLIHNGIHASIDPKTDLTAGAMYTLRLGNQLKDLGGQALTPTTVTIIPASTRGTTPIAQTLRTRGADDPGPSESRSGVVPNEIVMDKPLIGRETTRLLDSALAAELHDPKSLGGPIAFTLRKGQRLAATGLDIKLGGQIPSGLSTGDLHIELLTDAGGRIYRNPYQPAEQRPENKNAPLYVDLSLDLAIFATDATGNATVTQTVLGVQATGTAIATDGVLAIEQVASMDMGLLGVTAAPTNMVMELITDEAATVPTDTTAPKLVSSMPSMSGELPVDAGIELIFDEPIDIERARAGGIRLEDTTVTGAVAISIESHGAALVLRPRAPLAYSKIYRIVFADVADTAGNQLTTNNLSFVTGTLMSTNVGTTVSAVYPGVACALTGGTASSPGRCAGGQTADQMYKPFTIAANEPIEVAFTAPIRRAQTTLGTACNTGAVRVEETDAAGTCTAVVAGTLMVRDRTLTFVPDQPWTVGKRYKFSLVSGGDTTCNANEVCGTSSAANFDPLAGNESGDAGGPSLVIPFTGVAPTGGTFLVTAPYPVTDINGSGLRDTSEPLRDENRAALRITGTSGTISDAVFDGEDCIPSTPMTKEACMYLAGSMPADMGEVTTTCPLPGGQTASACVPVKLSPQLMYGTSVSMTATAIFELGSTPTGMQMMRIREPANGPVMGYIVDRNGTPTMIVELELYMDAADMSPPLGSSHDLHSKGLKVILEGPLRFLSDGRIAIQLANTAELPVKVTIDPPILSEGTIDMIVPKGEMKLSLVSPAQRGVSL
jgi:hypothetical protein